MKKTKHVVGEHHPTQPWIWVEYKPGKFDWRSENNAKKYANKEYYLVEVFIKWDSSNIANSKNFSNLEDASEWAKNQVEGIDAPYKGYVSKVFFVEEIKNFMGNKNLTVRKETDRYYGNWSSK